jgi:hypothetical protein
MRVRLTWLRRWLKYKSLKKLLSKNNKLAVCFVFVLLRNRKIFNFRFQKKLVTNEDKKHNGRRRYFVGGQPGNGTGPQH